MTKKCTKCGEDKDLIDFHRQALGKFGVTSRCRPCVNLASSQKAKANRKQQTERVKRWRHENREKVKSNERAYYAATRPERIASVLAWQARNPEKKLMAGAAYRAKNNEALKAWRWKNKNKIYDWNAQRDQKQRAATPAWLSVEEKSCMAAIYQLRIRVSKCTGILHHVDHVHPINGKDFCGLHVPWNLRVIPARLNLKKTNKLERSCYQTLH